jgi:hypothetical protein
VEERCSFLLKSCVIEKARDVCAGWYEKKMEGVYLL